MKGYLNLNLKPMRKGICQGGVVVILGDCGSLDPGSNLGPGLIFVFFRYPRHAGGILSVVDDIIC